jgi:anti-sigma B factor antagonist
MLPADAHAEGDDGATLTTQGMATPKSPDGATVEVGVKMSGGSRRFTATPVPGPQTAVVPLPVEIDAANIGLVEAAVASALASRPTVLIADGTSTAFCDSAGIAALIHAHRRAAATGAQLRVVITGSSVRRILELIGADQLLLVYPSLTDAQANRSPEPAPPTAADPESREIA